MILCLSWAQQKHPYRVILAYRLTDLPLATGFFDYLGLLAAGLLHTGCLWGLNTKINSHHFKIYDVAGIGFSNRKEHV